MAEISKALVSVWNKSGLAELARALTENDVELIATGGTADHLEEEGFQVTRVAEYTGSPELLSGRVKTLHPRLFAGILARRDEEEDMKDLQDENIAPIDLVVCNLYPFSEQIESDPTDTARAAEMIDIGGISLIRAAAKNYQHVIVLPEPSCYQRFIDEFEKGGPEESLRKDMAQKAFQISTHYDACISRDFPAWSNEEDEISDFIFMSGKKQKDLRYGENPHQQAALFASGQKEKFARGANLLNAEQLNGQEMSYNNMKDAAAALSVVQEFPERPAAAIIKHTNPCGLAAASSSVVAFRRAYAGDPQSAYGGIAGINRQITESVAREMSGGRKFLEVVVAPDFTAGAVEILSDRWEDIRLLELEEFAEEGPPLDISIIPGGFLVQEKDERRIGAEDLEVVVGEDLDEEETDELLFSWRAVKHVKSNAVVLARDDAVVGVGAGQMSRIDALHMAGRKASGRQRGGVLASDAFFPFPDAVQEADELGIKTIIQPGGSVRDEEIKKACEKAGIRMVFTGTRHFLH